MTRPLAVVLAVGAVLAISSRTNAQELAPTDARSARTIRPAPGGILAPSSTAPRGTIVADFLQTRGADAETAASLRSAGERTARGTGLSHLSMVQEVSGLQVYGTYVKAAFNANGDLVHVVENVARVPASGVIRTQLAAAQALRAALQEIYPGQAFNPVEAGRSGNTTTFSAGPFFYRNPSVTAMALQMTDNVLRAGFLVETWSRGANELHHTVVGGDGRVLSVESRTNTETDKYNVFVEDPGKGPQTIVDGSAGGTGTPSPLGWLAAGSHSTVNIGGNNAHAYLDTDNNGVADGGGTEVTNGQFLTAASLGVSPTIADNRNVAVQNLFYLNNVIHDLLYGFGFDEAAGNFQVDNFGLGGLGSDAVNAEAQDGGGTDNANFATPADGLPPRMQMYLWTGLGDHQVLAGSDTYLAGGAAFGPALTTSGIAGALMVAADSTAPTGDACETIAAGQLTGKIAIVDRGVCNFTVKVRNAQAAGAIGVIVVNNIPEGAFVSMAGRDGRIRIPSVMVSFEDGATLKGTAGPATARRNPDTPLQIDASLDSDIVFHEYCHGLTWRMIGGMSGPISGAIGEGMSDACALLINGDDRVGEYSFSVPLGIRRSPYATYPNTYSDVTGAEVHNDGEIYAAIAWRMKENFAAAGLTADDLFNYLVQGMSLTPSGPSFEAMRDGILDAIDDPGHECLVWDAFAYFGVGEGSSATISKKKGGSVIITESFTKPVSCTP